MAIHSGSPDAQLGASEQALCVATADPLAVIWFGTLLLWDADAFFPDWEAAQRPAGGQSTTQC